MSFYTFYPTHAGGLCETFQCFDVLDGDCLRSLAFQVLADHPSAQRVDVYDEVRMVLTVDRVEVPAALAVA